MPSKRKQLGIKLFFNELNEARIAFKHLGIPPNMNHFHDCVAKTRRYLDETCRSCLGLSLEEVGLEALIEDGDNREPILARQDAEPPRELQRILGITSFGVSAGSQHNPFRILGERGQTRDRGSTPSIRVRRGPKHVHVPPGVPSFGGTKRHDQVGHSRQGASS